MYSQVFSRLVSVSRLKVALANRLIHWSDRPAQHSLGLTDSHILLLRDRFGYWEILFVDLGKLLSQLTLIKLAWRGKTSSEDMKLHVIHSAPYYFPSSLSHVDFKLIQFAAFFDTSTLAQKPKVHFNMRP